MKKKYSGTCTTETIKAPSIYTLNFTLREGWRNEERAEVERHTEFDLKWQNAVKNLGIESP